MKDNIKSAKLFICDLILDLEDQLAYTPEGDIKNCIVKELTDLQCIYTLLELENMPEKE